MAVERLTLLVRTGKQIPANTASQKENEVHGGLWPEGQSNTAVW